MFLKACSNMRGGVRREEVSKFFPVSSGKEQAESAAADFTLQRNCTPRDHWAVRRWPTGIIGHPFIYRLLFASVEELEARGVEPLSSSLSTQTSTCLAGEIFKKPTLHWHTADFRASTNFLHRPARSLRRPISLLSTFGAVAGVQLQTSRSIKPRERDLGDLRLFVLARFLTRPTNHPRHAACASNDESKPVRPRPTNIQWSSFLGKTAQGRRLRLRSLSSSIRQKNM